MLRVFDFQCAKGHITEKFIGDSVKVIQCPHCGNDATRLLTAPRISLEGISGDFPGAAMSWERKRQSHIAWERKTGRSEEALSG